MAHTVWDVANAARIPATTTLVKLYPQRLSKGLKDNIVSALRNGVAAGGHRAYGAIIAKKLSDKFGLEIESSWNSRSVYVRGHTSEGIRAEIAKLIQADASAEILNPTHEFSYYISGVKNASARQLKLIMTLETSSQIDFYDSALRKKARSLAQIGTSHDYAARAEKIIALLDKEDPITIETF
jgi:hypothetical protein